jgi:hypothetical protein
LERDFRPKEKTLEALRSVCRGLVVDRDPAKTPATDF